MDDTATFLLIGTVASGLLLVIVMAFALSWYARRRSGKKWQKIKDLIEGQEWDEKFDKAMELWVAEQNIESLPPIKEEEDGTIKEDTGGVDSVRGAAKPANPNYIFV